MPNPFAGPVAFNGGVLEPPYDLPAFTLQRVDGKRFATSDTRGRVSLFFFGYTSCPDICPMTLAQVAHVRRQLGERAGKVDAYFITVDPARDTPQRLASYVAGFDPAIVALTGSPVELERARAAFGAVAQSRAGAASENDSSTNHTAIVFLVDAQSRLRLIFPYGMTPAQIVADIEHLLP
ncbi:MAG: SCO family protein [Chloroflexi bacterium]|nr:SCO family protein [Chloroflexota bacterium]